jgi:hypothetical protein
MSFFKNKPAYVNHLNLQEEEGSIVDGDYWNIAEKLAIYYYSFFFSVDVFNLGRHSIMRGAKPATVEQIYKLIKVIFNSKIVFPFSIPSV